MVVLAVLVVVLVVETVIAEASATTTTIATTSSSSVTWTRTTTVSTTRTTTRTASTTMPPTTSTELPQETTTSTTKNSIRAAGMPTTTYSYCCIYSTPISGGDVCNACEKLQAGSWCSTSSDHCSNCGKIYALEAKDNQAELTALGKAKAILQKKFAASFVQMGTKV